MQHTAPNKVNIFSSDKGQKDHIAPVRPTRHFPLSSLQGRTVPPLGRSPAAPLCPPPALRVQPPSVPLTPAPVLKTSRAPQSCRRGRRCHFPRSRIRRPPRRVEPATASPQCARAAVTDDRTAPVARASAPPTAPLVEAEAGLPSSACSGLRRYAVTGSAASADASSPWRALLPKEPKERWTPADKPPRPCATNW